MDSRCVEDGEVILELHLFHDSETSCTKSVGTDLSMEDIKNLQTEVLKLREVITSLEEKLNQQQEKASTEDVHSKARLLPTEPLTADHSTLLEMEDEPSLTLHCYTDPGTEEALDRSGSDQHALQNMKEEPNCKLVSVCERENTVEHCTVLKSEDPPIPKRCSSCCSKFHCPFCPPSVYKPRHDAYSVNKHLQCHISHAVRERGYIICMCHLGCRLRGHFHCPICSKTVVRKSDAQSHISACQGDSDRSLSEAPRERSHHCSECGETFKSKYHLVYHQRTHQTVQEPNASTQENHTGEDLHCTVLKSEDPPVPKRCSSCCSKFHCPFCPPSVYKPRHDAYSVNKHLQCHISHAVRERGYIVCMCQLGCRLGGHFHCPICAKTVVRKKDAQSHISSCQGQESRSSPESDPGEKAYHCSYCGKILKSKRNLIHHLRIHTGEKPYLCAFCGKQFANHCSFSVHQRMHTGEKPFRCSTCAQGFNRKSEFLIHQRKHTGEKPYLCATCGKQLSSRKTLSAHHKSHSGERPHRCVTCGKTFILKSSLTAHRGTHTRPYTCSLCGKTFGRSDNLKAHEKTHAQEKS